MDAVKGGCSVRSPVHVREVVAGFVLLVVALVVQATAQENYATWGSSRRVDINTASTGASVGGTVTGFPVLVRLNPARFDGFATTSDVGADIRFAKADGTHLPYHIERWLHVDANTDTAEIWVLVDTVYGNKADQYITMYFNNAAAADSSKPASVFSAANGFNCVWHFAGNGNDATGGGSTMGASGTGGTLGAAAIVGGGVDVGSVDYMLNAGAPAAVAPQTDMTFSFWARPSAVPAINTRMAIARKSSGQMGAYDFWFDGAQHANFSWANTTDTIRTAINGTKLAINTWYYVTGVHKLDSVMLYVNTGRSLVKTGAVGTLASPDWGLRVGAESNASMHFPGAIDEVRVERVARSADWVKLCYQSQRATDSLVTIESGTCTPINITANPRDTTLSVGGNATFTVIATGSSTGRTYQWWRGGTAIGGATNSSYTVSNAQQTDSGATFYVVVSNSCPSTQTSTVATLRVTPACTPPSISASPRDTTVTLGANLTLSVSASGTTLAYQWRKDAGNLVGKNASTLVINPVAATDAGVYDCIVSNGCGSPTSAGARLTVCTPLAITQHPQGQTAIAGSPVVFTVTVTGSNPLYQWQRRHGSWANATGSSATQQQYSFNTDTTQNGDSLRVIVSNGCGLATSNAALLTVQGQCQPAVVSVEPVDTTVIERSSANLHLVATGTQLSFQWQRSGANVAGATTNPYSFAAQRSDNRVGYRCIVSGQCGADTSRTLSLGVTDTTRPNPTAQLTVNALGPTSINVRWTTPESDSTDRDSVWVRFSTSGYPAVGGGQSLKRAGVTAAVGTRDTTMTGLTTGTRYYFTLFVTDTVGNVACADSDTVTPTASGLINPVTLRGVFVDDTHIRLTLSNFCALRGAVDPFGLYADYIGVWYATGAYPATPDTTRTSYARYTVAALQTSAGCPGTTQRDTTISVPSLAATSDSVYYLSASVRYRHPDTLLPFQAGNGATVLMRDVTPPSNPCTISGVYPGGMSDSAWLNITNLSGADRARVARVKVFCSFDSTFSDTFFLLSVPLDTALAHVSGGTYRVSVRDSRFAGAVRTVYCAVALVGLNGVSSASVRSHFDVGHPVPPNPVVLTAHTLSSFEVALVWPGIGASGADSIRVWYDTVQIPLDVQTVATTFPPQYTRGYAVGDTVTNLNPSRLYYFGVQAKIAGDWTPITAASRAFAVTDTVNPGDTISNTIVIDSARFDTAQNRIKVVWHYTLRDSAQYGYALGVDSAAASGAMPAVWTDALQASNVTYILLGDGIVFDTTYHVFMRLRKKGGLQTGVTDLSLTSVQVPKFTWQSFTYFKSTTDTVRTFNKHVLFWFAGPGTWGFGPDNSETVVAQQLEPPPEGFIPVSVAFSLRECLPGPKITIAVRYDSVPAAYRDQDVRMYRRTADGRWLVVRTYTLDAARRLVSSQIDLGSLLYQTLVLMIDTERPQVHILSNIDAPVNPATVLLDSLQITDNCANVRVSLLYARGENAAMVRSGPGTGGSLDSLGTNVVKTSILADFVTDVSGVRAYVVVSDGLYTDTVNISRQVNVQRASDVATEAGQWVPLRVAARLGDSTLAPVITGVLGGPGYDIYKCRVFRWFDPSSTDGVSNGPHSWVEYDAARAVLFDLVPGRLMWIKTRQSPLLDFGGGVTVSLRDTVKITLPPTNWTDFALPYRFNVRIGDIIAATGSMGDSLQFYSWNKTTAPYVPQVLYVKSLPPDTVNSNPAATLGGTARDGFTVYNRLPSPVTLRIPPTTSTMSAFAKPLAALAKGQSQGGAWALTLVSRTTDGRALANVIFGYTAGSGAKTWYPAPPSFTDVGVRAYDASSGKSFGNVVAHHSENGGHRFDVVFSNDGSEPVDIVYRVNGGERLADSLLVRVIDSRSGASERADALLSVQVPAKSRVYRAISVGPASYHAGDYAGVRPLAQFAAYPNPFHGAVTVRFLLPENIGRVELAVYDGLGRRVWQRELRSVTAGTNQVLWDGLGTAGNATATGIYLLRVRAFDQQGKSVKTKTQRLVYLP